MISTFTAFIDSNVFFGARLRSLVLSLAQTGLFRARWSHYVHEEWTRAVLEKRPDLEAAALASTRVAMDRAVPDCLVSDYHRLAATLTLPDAADRPILAAAILARASVIVTFNQKHFPADELETFGLHTRHPDDFILDVASIDDLEFLQAVRWDFQHYRRPPINFDAYVDSLKRAGAPKAAALITDLRIVIEGEP